MAKFFLSHSADEGSAARDYMDALGEAARAVGHQAFESSQIRSGDRWRGRVYQELATCDAAIVLMDRAALESRWVLREVDILIWRRHWGSVEIQVRLLDGVTSDDVRAGGFGGLTEVQFEWSATAAEMIAGFGPLPVDCDDPMRTWIANVAANLGAAAVGPALHRFAKFVGLQSDEVAGLVPPGCYDFLAQQLLGRPQPEDTYMAVASMRYEIGGERTAMLAELATPALIDAEAARPLLHRDRPAPVYLLDAEFSSTVALYVMRASCCDFTYRIECVDGRTGENGRAELQENCERALARLTHLTRYSGGDLVRRLAQFRPSKMVQAAYLAIDMADSNPGPVIEVVRDLRSQLPWLSVIVLSASAREFARTWDLAGLVLLEPLADGEEFEVDRVLNAFEELGGKAMVQHG